jgi:starch synthase
MVINIASFGGRTHMLDTARELDNLGHDVRFYSYVPNWRAEKFGLKRKCNKSYFLIALPFLLLQKLSNRSFWSIYIFHRFFDMYVAMVMPSCDVFIGQSPLHVYALKVAKKKYGAVTILERGSSHIKKMIAVLESIPSNIDKCVMPNYILKRDLAGYDQADYISIASDFQKASFLEYNVPGNKLLINPYGTSLSQFEPTNKPEGDCFDVIMVGGWSYRKGCDLLVDACRMLNIKLLHVGSINDFAFPLDKNFCHVDAVEQSKLIEYYAKAKVFVLPSREDGFGMVLSQAIMCGLPIVCSRNTGGRDLKKLLEEKKYIIEMTEYSVQCLAACIADALEIANLQNEGPRSYAKDMLHNLSWQKYGERYHENIERIIRN